MPLKTFVKQSLAWASVAISGFAFFWVVSNFSQIMGPALQKSPEVVESNSAASSTMPDFPETKTVFVGSKTKNVIPNEISAGLTLRDNSVAPKEELLKIAASDTSRLRGLKVTDWVDFEGAAVRGLKVTTVNNYYTENFYTTSTASGSIGSATATAPPPIIVYNSSATRQTESWQPVVGQIGGVTYDFSVGRNLTVDQTATVGSSLTIASAATSGGSLTVYGGATISGTASLSVATLSGALTANGGVTLGDSSGDAITVNGRLSTLNISDGSTTSTISKNSLILAQDSSNALGKFYVDSSGNVSASGSITAFGGLSLVGNYLPASDNLYDVGSSSTQWRYGNFQGGLLVADGATTSTLQNNSFTFGQTSGSNLGKFYIDSSGNASASGTWNFGSYTNSGLPTSGTIGRLARVSDGTRGLWMDQGTQWFALNEKVVNVQEFGAKGDGVTDDTAAFSAAITAAGTSGTVRLPKPSNYYYIKIPDTYTAFILTQNVRIEGVSRDVKIKVGPEAPSGSSAYTLFWVQPGIDLTIENLTLEGPQNNNGKNFTALYHYPGSGSITAKHITSTKFGQFLKSENNTTTGQTITVDDVDVNTKADDTALSSFQISADYGTFHLRNCKVTNSSVATASDKTAYLVYVYQTNNVDIDNCEFGDTASYGIHIWGTTPGLTATPPDYVSITNSRFNGTYDTTGVVTAAAILTNNLTKTYIVNDTFNITSGTGKSIVVNGDAVISNSNFYNGDIELFGGSTSAASSTVYFDQSNFTNAPISPQSVAASTSLKWYVTNSHFNSTSTVQNIYMYARGGYMSLTNNVFEGATAEQILLYGGELEANNNRFMNNNGSYGIKTAIGSAGRPLITAQENYFQDSTKAFSIETTAGYTPSYVNLRPRHAATSTPAASASSLTLDWNYDTYRVTGATTINNIYLQDSVQTLFSGGTITLLSDTGSTWALGNTGNVKASGGPRPVDRSVSLTYFPDRTAWFQTGADSNLLSGSNFLVTNNSATSSLGANFLSIASSTTDMAGKFYVDSSGNTAASGTLTVWGGASTGGLLISATNSTTTFTSYASGAGAGAFVFNTATALSTASSSVLLSVRNGGNKVFSISNDGYVASTGTFNANVASTGIGDVAEYVNLVAGESAEPGDVLIIDILNPNKYKKSDTAYAKAVAGAVSDTGAFIIGASGQGRVPLALAGLVKIKVTNEAGSIQAGDYLVTASKPGYAMKYNQDNPQPAGLVGMALESLTDTEGKITVMINKGLMSGANAALTVSADSSGQLTQNGPLDLNGQSIINISSIKAKNNSWQIDESGNLVQRLKTNKGDKDVYNLASNEKENFVLAGAARLENGQKQIIFDELDKEIISQNAPLKIFITSAAENIEIFVSERSNAGFTVKEKNSGVSNTAFDWLVIARRKTQAEIDRDTTNATDAATDSANTLAGYTNSSSSLLVGGTEGGVGQSSSTAQLVVPADAGIQDAAASSTAVGNEGE